MELRVLGDIEAWIEDRRIEVGHARQRCVLSVLVMDANQVVTVDQLLERVWSQDLPHGGRQVLRTYLSRLRLLLSPGGLAIERRPNGYVLLAEPESMDVHYFHRLVAQARAADDMHALGLFDQALALWRGEPFAGLQTPWLATVRVGLERERDAAQLDHIDVALRHGQHTQLLPTLSALAGENPLDERIAGQLMLALYRAGRQADALMHYQRTRQHLAEELGTDPGPELQQSQQRILTADPGLMPAAITPLAAELGTDPGTELRGLYQSIPRGELPPPVPKSVAPTRTYPVSPTRLPSGVSAFPGRDIDQLPGTDACEPLSQNLACRPLGPVARPAQLPAMCATFVGRDAQVQAMSAVFAGKGLAGVPRTIAIDGPPGVGKTTLTLRLAHDVAQHYPDGQLYVDLRGFSPENQPRAADDVLEEFLAELGVRAAAIPTDPERRAALYRSAMATRRMLVVLDNALDSRQVLPLVPASTSCGVLITSRRRLLGLGMNSEQRISLGPLAEHESLTLLRLAIGTDRSDREPQALRTLARLCGHLPLALRIAAERIAIQPHQPIGELVSELTQQPQRLDLLTADDSLAVRTAFSWSYRDLDPTTARMFRLLGLHYGRQISTHAAAALVGEPRQVARRLLDQLARVHLLEGLGGDRYRMHDLLAIYAAELTTAQEPEPERNLAVRRVVDWYLHNAYAANQALAPRRRDPPLDRSNSTIDIADFDYNQALTWCETEMENIVMATQLALAAGENTTAWKLPVGCFNYLFLHKRWSSWIASHQNGITGAQRAGDLFGEAWVTNNLAVAYRDSGHKDKARTYFERALSIRREIGDRLGQAWTLFGIALLDLEEKKLDEAAELFKEARSIFHQVNERLGEAEAIANMGDVYRKIGRYNEALTLSLQALALFQALEDGYGQGLALAGIGGTYARLNQFSAALDHFHRSLEKRREVGDRWGEGKTLYECGKLHLAAERPEPALECLRAALEILAELDGPSAAEIRAILAHDD